MLCPWKAQVEDASLWKSIVIHSWRRPSSVSHIRGPSNFSCSLSHWYALPSQRKEMVREGFPLKWSMASEAKKDLPVMETGPAFGMGLKPYWDRSTAYMLANGSSTRSPMFTVRVRVQPVVEAIRTPTNKMVRAVLIASLYPWRSQTAGHVEATATRERRGRATNRPFKHQVNRNRLLGMLPPNAIHLLDPLRVHVVTTQNNTDPKQDTCARCPEGLSMLPKRKTHQQHA